MKIFEDFVCSCGTEEMERCESIVSRVCESLRVDTDRLFTAVVYNMQCMDNGISVMITSIPSDQWAAIEAEIKKYDSRKKVYCRYGTIRVQCDKLEHGLARVYEIASEVAERAARYPRKRRSRREIARP